MIPDHPPAIPKDLWIPGCFVAFFALLFIVEAAFVAVASQSFTGLVTDNAYTVGLNYNEVLAQREVERKLGWKTELSFEQGEKLEGRLSLRIHDAKGQPVVADKLRATAERMSRFPQIEVVNYQRQSDGSYLAHLSVPLAGRWFIRARIQRDEQVIHIIDEVEVLP